MVVLGCEREKLLESRFFSRPFGEFWAAPKPGLTEHQTRHMKSIEQHRSDIVEIGRRVYRLGYVAAYDGNISIRLEDGTILCTPTAISKGYMTEGDLVIVDADGKMVSGSRKVSSEIAMHLLIYKLRSDVHAVVHAHPPCATGYAAAGMPLNKALVAEVVMTFGCVPLAPYGTTGTPELTEAMCIKRTPRWKRWSTLRGSA